MVIAGVEGKGQQLGSVDEVDDPSTSYIASPYDGMLGFAFPAASFLPQPGGLPLFHRLIHENVLAEPVFSLQIAGESPHLVLGGTDEEYGPNNIEFHPVRPSGEPALERHWELAGASVHINGAPVPGLTNLITVIDSGANFIYGPSSLVEKIYAHVPGAQDDPEEPGEGLWAYPCDAALPDIGFSWGGKTWVISAAAYVELSSLIAAMLTCETQFQIPHLGQWKMSGCHRQQD